VPLGETQVLQTSAESPPSPYLVRPLRIGEQRPTECGMVEGAISASLEMSWRV